MLLGCTRSTPAPHTWTTQPRTDSSVAPVAAVGLGNCRLDILRLLLHVGDSLSVVLGSMFRHRHGTHHVLGVRVVTVILIDALRECIVLRLVHRLSGGDDVARLMNRLGYLLVARRHGLMRHAEAKELEPVCMCVMRSGN